MSHSYVKTMQYGLNLTQRFSLHHSYFTAIPDMLKYSILSAHFDVLNGRNHRSETKSF
eukprot:UN15036